MVEEWQKMKNIRYRHSACRFMFDQHSFPLPQQKQSFQKLLITGWHQSLGRIYHDGVGTNQHPTLITPHTTDYGARGRLRCGHADLVKKRRDLILSTEVQGSHFPHAAITRNVGFYATGMHGRGTDTARQ